MQSEKLISEELHRRINAASRVMVLTGAGVSAESGVPTFRGGGGTAVWKGMPFDLISSAGMIKRNLAEVRAWFDYRRGLIAKLHPNPAHATIARWEERFTDFTLVTQNIDGLHQMAGSRRVLELHGSIWRVRCVACSTRYDLGQQQEDKLMDACVACGEHLRPDVVLFGELLPMDVFELAATKASECELCFIIGTSAVVYPAAALPEMACRAGAYTVEINPERTPLSELCDETIQGKAGEILPLLDAV